MGIPVDGHSEGQRGGVQKQENVLMTSPLTYKRREGRMGGEDRTGRRKSSKRGEKRGSCVYIQDCID